MEKKIYGATRFETNSMTRGARRKLSAFEDENRLKKEICLGDRIFARLIMGGRLVAEFVVNSVGSVKDLLDEMRQKIVDLRGLGKLQIRNQSRGWAEERHIMFY